MNHSHAAANRSRLHKILLVAAPLLILAAGAATAVVLIASRPTAGKSTPAASAPLVRTMAAATSDHAVSFEVMGTVTPAREVTLRARVSGHVAALARGFTPGGLLHQGEPLLTLDGDDYRLALSRAESAVDTARAALDIEMGQQGVARAQLKMLTEAAGALDGDVSLALREPQLAQAKASLASALADLDQARLNLERTTVRAPFNALVTERSVNVGSEVSTSDALAVLVGTDEYWIEAAVPVDRLRWMRFADGDGQGSEALVSARSQQAPLAGRVLRRTGSLAQASRMARVLISVPDPLGLERGGSPLLLDEYVGVRVTGETMRGVVALPRTALREGRAVWLYDQGLLRIRPVTVAWADEDTAYVCGGIEPGERVVTSDISSPVEGMALRLSGDDASGAVEGSHAG